MLAHVFTFNPLVLFSHFWPENFTSSELYFITSLRKPSGSSSEKLWLFTKPIHFTKPINQKNQSRITIRKPWDYYLWHENKIYVYENV